MLVGLLAGCGNNSSVSAVISGSQASEATSQAVGDSNFTYFLGTGEDSSYYDSYEKNPTLNWLMNYNTWGPSKSKVNVSFQIPATGQTGNVLTTMMGTGDYTDIIDWSYGGSIGTITDMYNNGVAMDITDYVDKYMPNYKAWLTAHPDYEKLCTNMIDGKRRNLSIWGVNDTNSPWGGYCYRRDWIAKYGTNPKTGVAFTGGYDANKVWSDDVVFPSGKSDPLTISDWEWMFDIFQKAIKTLGIQNGYCFQIPYYGYGDFTSAFNTGSGFYLDLNTKKFNFGGASDNMREYLKLANKWYKAGYVDTKFAEHTTDMFYAIDSTKVHQGRVGMWSGLAANLNDMMDISEGKENNDSNGYTNGICVYGAREPINDKYGTADMQNVDPYSFYRIGLTVSGTLISTKAKDKNLASMLSMFDYLYSDEGTMLCTAGLSKEQYEQTKDAAYTKFGLTEGAYDYVDSKGQAWVEGTSTGDKLWEFNNKVNLSDDVRNAMKDNRTIGRRLGAYNKSYTTRPAVYMHGINEWSEYESNFNIDSTVTSSLSSDDSKTYSSKNTTLSDLMNQYYPHFIIGDRDVNSDSVWSGFKTLLNKYKPDTVVTILQNAYDNL